MSQDLVLVQSAVVQSVVLDSSNNVVQTVDSTQTVLVTDPSIITQELDSTNSITISSTEHVVVQEPNTSVIVTGQQGPQGPQGPAGISEEQMAYSKRTDFITENLLYRGEAQPGTAETSANWRIRKVVLGVDGDVTETWADGTADFSKQWSLRSQYTYT